MTTWGLGDSFIHLFITYLLGVCYAPVTDLGSTDTLPLSKSLMSKQREKATTEMPWEIERKIENYRLQ